MSNLLGLTGLGWRNLKVHIKHAHTLPDKDLLEKYKVHVLGFRKHCHESYRPAWAFWIVLLRREIRRRKLPVPII